MSENTCDFDIYIYDRLRHLQSEAHYFLMSVELRKHEKTVESWDILWVATNLVNYNYNNFPPSFHQKDLFLEIWPALRPQPEEMFWMWNCWDFCVYDTCFFIFWCFIKLSYQTYLTLSDLVNTGEFCRTFSRQLIKPIDEEVIDEIDESALFALERLPNSEP